MEKIRFNWIDKNLMKQMDIASNIQKILEFSYLRLPRYRKSLCQLFFWSKAGRTEIFLWLQDIGSFFLNFVNINITSTGDNIDTLLQTYCKVGKSFSSAKFHFIFITMEMVL